MSGSANITNKMEQISPNIYKAKEALCKADAIILDVDRTIIYENTLLQLAIFLKRSEGIEEMVDCAAKDVATLHENIAKAAFLLKPTKEEITNFRKTFPYTFLPGVQEFIEYLHSRDVKVYLVSESADCLVEPIGQKLQIPLNRIFSNRFEFFFRGDLGGFSDELLKPLGKSTIVRLMTAKYPAIHLTPRYKHVVVIGDSYTDACSSAYADAAIGFGGAVVNEDCKRRCDWFVTSFKELHDYLLENTEQTLEI